jgi:hypothetical protein
MTALDGFHGPDSAVQTVAEGLRVDVEDALNQSEQRSIHACIHKLGHVHSLPWPDSHSRSLTAIASYEVLTIMDICHYASRGT